MEQTVATNLENIWVIIANIWNKQGTCGGNKGKICLKMSKKI